MTVRFPLREHAIAKGCACAGLRFPPCLPSRKDGHYWVKLIGNEQWTVAKYRRERSRNGKVYQVAGWRVPDYDQFFDSDDYVAIDETPLTYPQS